MKHVVLICCCLFVVARAQHTIPFASINNSIELSVANSSVIDAEHIRVTVMNPPEWVRFNDRTKEIPSISAHHSSSTLFTFSLLPSAPVGTREQLHFSLISSTGEQWQKSIDFVVAPPESFELFQNFPNPFNPSTTISYQLPIATNVNVKIFDLLGKEIETIADGMEPPGAHQHQWSGSSKASGMYLYQLSYRDRQGTLQFLRKKLLLTK